MRFLVLCLLCFVHFVSMAQTVFDGLPSQPPTVEQVLRYKEGSAVGADNTYVYGSLSAFADHFREDSCVTGDSIAHVIEYVCSNEHIEFSEEPTRGKWVVDVVRYNLDGNGERYNPYSYTREVFFRGKSFGEDTCSSPFSYLHNGACYNPAGLATNSDCDSNDIIPYYEGGETSVCTEKADGSRCNYNKVDGIAGTAWYELGEVENNQCFTDGQEIFTPPTTNNNGQGCFDIGAQTLVCPEDPNNVCNNGVCQSGCGTIDVGNGEQFVCFSNDTDGDGTGDYKDDDIDGDGVPNDVDNDDDGDGVPDEDDDDHIDNNQPPSPDLSDLGTLINTGNNLASSQLSELSNISSSLEDITNVEFSTTAGGRVADGINGLFTQEDVDNVKAEAQTLQTELSTRIEEIKTEAAAMFDLDNPSGGFDSRTITLKNQTYDISFERFRGSFSQYGAVVLFIAVLIVASIILGGRR